MPTERDGFEGERLDVLRLEDLPEADVPKLADANGRIDRRVAASSPPLHEALHDDAFIFRWNFLVSASIRARCPRARSPLTGRMCGIAGRPICTS